ncbi:hypothetical protein [Flavobacterium notoginsengisoli]|uniref:hypothetical protein n=1 Tax=Flavobacterium notoginsengisoli TaxID=1478199 RepID=UPI00362A7933
MDTLKCFSLMLISLLLISCNEYIDRDYSLQGIYLKEWNSSICPKKVVYEEYIKNTNFKKIIYTHSSFEIRDCEIEMHKYNQRLFTPKILTNKTINYDIRIVIDDSLEYKITDIKSRRDTTKYVFALGRKCYIDNTIYSMLVNDHQYDNKKSINNIVLITKSGRIIKNKLK